MAPETAAAPGFAALGDPFRLAVLVRLCRDGPLPTARLTAGSGITRQAVTKHLRTLEDVGLVRSDLVGRDRLWQVDRPRLDAMRDYLDDISREWDERLARLRAVVEQEG